MTDRVLPAVVVLRSDQDREHPVWDLERLCRVVLDGHLRNLRRRLAPVDYAEALSFLLGESYIICDKYDGRGTFTGYMAFKLPLALRDHLRAPYGTRSEDRLGEGRLDDGRPVNPATGEEWDIDPIDAIEDADPARGTRLDAALQGVEADALDGRLDDLAGLFVRRDWADAWAVLRVGRRSSSEITERDRGLVAAAVRGLAPEDWEEAAERALREQGWLDHVNGRKVAA